MSVEPLQNFVDIVKFAVAIGCCALLIIFYLAFSNQILALIITLILKLTKLGKQSHIKIGSVSFALLGGRILFRDVSYVTKNASLKIVDGYVTIWWWFPRRGFANTNKESNITVHLNGLEYFIFNNTGKYEHIRNILAARAGRPVPEAPAVEPAKTNSRFTQFYELVNSIGIDIRMGSIIFGNNYLETLTLITFDRAVGVNKLDKPRSELDLYSFIIDMIFEKATVRLIPNALHEKPPGQHNPPYIQPLQSVPVEEEDMFTSTYESFKKVFKDVDFPFVKGDQDFELDEDMLTDHQPPLPQANQNHGSHDERDKNAFKKKRLNQKHIVFENTNLRVRFYRDEPGLVPPRDDPRFNTDPPPEQGVDIQIEAETFTYGPWQDHQRGHIQNFFFPWTYENQEIYRPEVGKPRQHHYFDIKLTWVEDTTWKVPFVHTPKTKEEKEAGSGPEGLLSLNFVKGSCMEWHSPMVALDESGSRTRIKVHFIQCELVTSNTNAIFGMGDIKADIQLHNYLLWNDLRDWKFRFTFVKPTIYFLYDHVRFIQDIINHWKKSPYKIAPDLLHFVPYKYTYEFLMEEFSLNLHANEYNLIEKPNDPQRNVFFILSGPTLSISFIAPSTKFEAKGTDYLFDVRTHGQIEMQYPLNHPVQVNLKSSRTKFMSASNFRLFGNYYIHNKVHDNYLDSIGLNIELSDLDAMFTGYTLRGILAMWKNYFAWQKAFVSLEELLQSGLKNEKNSEISAIRSTDVNDKPLPSNALEVCVALTINGGNIALPYNLHDRREAANVSANEFTLEVRYLPTYIDICINCSPFTVDMDMSADDEKIPGARKSFIGVHGLDLWGHLMTGPPPQGIIYKALIKLVIGQCSAYLVPSQLGGLKSFLENFLYHWNLDYNTVSPQDLTRLVPFVNKKRWSDQQISMYRYFDVSVSVKSITAAILGHVGMTHAALREGISFAFESLNDGKTHKTSQLSIPSIEVKTLSLKDVNMYADDGNWLEVGRIITGLRLQTKNRRPSVNTDFDNQRAFLMDQDGSTRRLEFLWCDHNQSECNDLNDAEQFNEQQRREQQNAEIYPQPQPATASSATGITTKQTVVSSVEDEAEVDTESQVDTMSDSSSKLSSRSSRSKRSRHTNTETDTSVEFYDAESDESDMGSDADEELDFDFVKVANPTSGPNNASNQQATPHNNTNSPLPKPLLAAQELKAAKGANKSDQQPQPQPQPQPPQPQPQPQQPAKREGKPAVPRISIDPHVWSDTEDKEMDSSEDDEDYEGTGGEVFFYKGKKKKGWHLCLPITKYYKFLRLYDVENSNNDAPNPSQFKGRKYFFAPSKFGCYSQLPEVILKEATSARVEKVHKKFDNDENYLLSPIQHQYRGNTNGFNAIDPTSEPTPDDSTNCQTDHIHLDIKDTDVFFSPNFTQIIHELINALEPPRADIDDILDSLEKNHLIAKKSSTPAVLPEWLYSRTKISCALNILNVHVLQAMRPPAVIEKSEILGRAVAYSCKAVALGFFTIVSVCFKNYTRNPATQTMDYDKKMYSIGGSIKLKSANATVQCLNKKVKAFKGIPINKLSFLVEGQPVVFVFGIQDLSVTWKYVQDMSRARGGSNNIDGDARASDGPETWAQQGAVSFSVGAISASAVQEIPAILHTLFGVWKTAVTEDLLNELKETKMLKKKAEVVVLAAAMTDSASSAQKNDSSAASSAQQYPQHARSSSDGSRIASVVVDIGPDQESNNRLGDSTGSQDLNQTKKAELIVLIRQKLRAMNPRKREELTRILKSLIQQPTDSTPDVETLKNTIENEDVIRLFVEEQQDKPPKSVQELAMKGTALLNQMLTTDLSLFIRKISLSIIDPDSPPETNQHDTQHSSSSDEDEEQLGSTNKTVVLVKNIEIKGKVKSAMIHEPIPSLPSDRIDSFDTSLRKKWNSFLNSQPKAPFLERTKRVRDVDIMLSVNMKTVSTDIHPSIMTTVACLQGLSSQASTYKYSISRSISKKVDSPSAAIGSSPHSAHPRFGRTGSDETKSVNFMAMSSATPYATSDTKVNKLMQLNAASNKPARNKRVDAIKRHIRSQTYSLDKPIDRRALGQKLLADDPELAAKSNTYFTLNIPGDRSSLQVTLPVTEDSITKEAHAQAQAQQQQQHEPQQKEPSVETRLVIFANIIVQGLEVRAWTDKNSCTELDVDNVSLVVNQPKKGNPISMAIEEAKPSANTSRASSDSQVLLLHSALLDITSINFRFKYKSLLQQQQQQQQQNQPYVTAQQAADANKFINLFEASVKGVNITEFWYLFNDKYQVNFVFGVAGISLHVPYTEKWSSASLHFRRYVQAWVKAAKPNPTNANRPTQPATKPANKTLEKQEPSTSSPSPAPAQKCIPGVNVTFDVRRVVAQIDLLPNLEVTYTISQIIASFSQDEDLNSTFRFHLYPNTLSFRTGSSSGSKASKQFHLPQIWVSGALETKNLIAAVTPPSIVNPRKSVSLSTSVIVEYLENTVTSDLLNHVLLVQSTMTNEFNAIVEAINEEVRGHNLKEKLKDLKAELPKTPASVSSLDIHFAIELLLEGFHLTALSPCSAVTFDTGVIRLKLHDKPAPDKAEPGFSIDDIKFIVTLDNMGFSMIDTYNFKWNAANLDPHTTQREMHRQLSSTSKCYKWAGASTNIKVQNFLDHSVAKANESSPSSVIQSNQNEKQVVKQQVTSSPSASPESKQSTPKTNKRRVLIEVRDTRIVLKPGCIDQGIAIFSHYNDAVSKFKNALKANRSDRSEAVHKLMKTGGQYYNYYSTKIVDRVSKDPTILISSGLIRILNTSLSIPFGDNSFNGFTNGYHSTFAPTKALKLMAQSIVLSTFNKTGDDDDDDSSFDLKSTQSASDDSSDSDSGTRTAEPISSGSRSKTLGLCKLSNIFGYFEDMEAKDDAGVPSQAEFEKAPNRAIIEKATVKVRLTTSDQAVDGSAECVVSGPEARTNASIVSFLLSFKDDWLDQKKRKHLTSPELDELTASSPVTPTDKPVQKQNLAPTTSVQRRVHVTCTATIEPGVCSLHHSVKNPTELESFLSAVASRVGKRGKIKSSASSEKRDGSTLMVAPLPSFSMEMVHSSTLNFKPPSTYSSSKAGTSASKSNTHVQLGIQWDGAKLSPSVVLFWEEMAIVMRKLEVEKTKKSRNKMLLRMADVNPNILQHQQNLIPFAWMRAIRAVLQIQRFYRGYRARNYVKKLRAAAKSNVKPLEIKRRQGVTGSSTRKRSEKSSRGARSSHTISFLCRIAPFKIDFGCAPVSDIVTRLEFPSPIDLLFSRASRPVQSGAHKGVAFFDNVFISAPQLDIRLFHHLSPSDFAKVQVLGLIANIGREFSGFLRDDDNDIRCGILNVESINLEGNIPQLHEFFIMAMLWSDKAEEARRIIKKGSSTLKETATTAAPTASGNSQQSSKQHQKQDQSLMKKRTIASVNGEEVIMRPTHTHVAILSINTVALKTDLDQPVGTQSVVVNKAVFSLRDRGRFENQPIRDPLVIEAFVGEGIATFKGRLSGACQLSGLSFQLKRQFRIGGSSPTLKGMSEVSFIFAPLQFECIYNEDKILHFIGGEQAFRFRDTDDAVNRIQGVFTSAGIDASLSSQTAPSFIKLANKIKAMVEERKVLALETLQNSGEYKGLGQLNTLLNDPIEEVDEIASVSNNNNNNDAKSDRGFAAPSLRQNLRTVGGITIAGQKVNVFMYGSPTTSIQFTMEKYRLKLKRDVHEVQSMIHRDLSMFLGKTVLTKLTQKKNKQSSSVILEIPGALFEMETKQPFDSYIVSYKYLTKFPQPIVVTTYLAEYNDIREVFKLYSTEIKMAKKHGTQQQAATSSHPISPSNVGGILSYVHNKSPERPFSLSSSSSSDFSSPSSSSSPSPPLLSNSSNNKPQQQQQQHHHHHHREFKCEAFELNPQLHVLGDMTPKVETVLNWLGIKDRHVIPSATHSGLTDALEVVLIGTEQASVLLSKALEERAIIL